ncbi:MAG TPA: hypothetical protein VEB64_09695 [Azospirillaceae bacterium]|nr:hypothetical protein [Azospirillaceae bacterium]
MPGNGQRGVALVAVLWGALLMAGIAAGVNGGARTEIRLARNAVLNAKAEALADAGVHRAVAGLRDPDPELQWHADGRPYRMSFGDAAVVVSIRDEGGKADLNTGAEEVLLAALIAAGSPTAEAVALAAAIADWRDPDGERSPRGAEDPDYAAAGRIEGAGDRPFEAVEELRSVLGLGGERYRRLRPFITVSGHQRGLDPTVAPPALLEALGAVVPPGSIDGGSDGRFVSHSARRAFTLRSEASLPDGTRFIREAIVYLTRDPTRPFVMLAWRQGALDPMGPEAAR